MLGPEATSFEPHLSVLGPSHFPRPTEGSHQSFRLWNPKPRREKANLGIQPP